MMPETTVIYWCKIIGIGCLYLCGINAAISCLTRLENKLRTPKGKISREVVDCYSLKVFKLARGIFNCLAVVEVLALKDYKAPVLNIVAGLALFLSGLALRGLAIKSLGGYWSFHIIKYPEQPVIRSGIYRYMAQPAYLGNMYLPGIYLITGALLTTLAATIFVAAFGIYRARIERSHGLCVVSG